MLPKKHTLFEVVNESEASHPVVAKWTEAHTFDRLDKNRQTRPHNLYVYDRFLPLFVRSFIQKLIGRSQHQPESILMPWFDGGQFAIDLRAADILSPIQALTCSVNEDVADQRLFGDLRVDLDICQPLNRLPELTERYDLIFGNMPFGWRAPDPPTGSIRDTGDSLLVYEASKLLSADGVGLFVVPPRFIDPTRSNNVYNSLTQVGLSIDACFYLDPGTFRPFTEIAGYLIIVRPGKIKDLFVAELPEDPQRADYVLNNYRQRKTDKSVDRGAVVDRGSFRGFPSLKAKDESDKLSKRMGVACRPFNDVIVGVNRPRRVKDEWSFEFLPNAIFLPAIGNKEAVTSEESFSLKPQNYLQLVVNEDVADKEYIARYFNEELGRLARQSATSGSTIPKITGTSIQHVTFYLPDVDTQRELLLLENHISDVSGELSALRKRIWVKPTLLSEHQRALQRINQSDGLLDWLKTLPYPLASILRAYHIADSALEKYSHLDHFFEAVTEFLAVLHLSAYRRDPDFDCLRGGLVDNLKEYGLSFEKATVGTWMAVLQRLVPETRRRLEDKKHVKVAPAVLFATQQKNVLDMLGSKKVSGVLHNTMQLRNDWRGHGGAVGENEAARRVERLEQYLSDVRTVFSDNWNDYRLMRPRSMEFRNGNFTCQARVIMGDNAQFSTETLEMTEPLETDRLCFVDEKTGKSLLLLPLVRMLPAPATDEPACYFYNRMEHGLARLVSYHYETANEQTLEMQEITDTLNELNGI
jgi:hypothetical protein